MKDYVSVVVPVYNVERYLEECIESIINQDYKKIEIILIDDGSKDLSPKICDKYVSKYDFIKCYHIKNNGVSNARNLGISYSNGEYLLFIDSDDYIESNMISSMVNEIKKDCDMVSVGYNYCYKDQKIYGMNKKSSLLTQNESIKELFLIDSINGFTPNKLFKLDIIKNNNIKFNNKIKICEDLLFCFEYLCYCNNTYVIDLPLYNYRMRKSSATNKKDNDLSVFDAYILMSKTDPNIYNYYKNYPYLYFKYKRIIKKNKRNDIKKASFIKAIFSKNISLQNKVKIICFKFLPSKVINRMLNLKQNKLNFYD